MIRAYLLLVALVACGDSTADDVDFPDAPPIAPGTAVTVAVTLRGEPVADVSVVFQAPDGAVVSADVTNERGVAGADIETGGFVTVIQPHSLGGLHDTLSTFAGVEVGDRLHIDLEEPGPRSSAGVDFTINNTETGVTSYVLQTTCGSNEGGTVESLVHVELVGCADNKVDALVFSRDEDGNPVTSYFTPDVDIAPTIDLSGGTFAPLQPVTVTYSELGSFGFVGIFRAYATARGRVFEANSGALSGAPVTLDVPADAGPIMLTSSTPFPDPSALGIQAIADWQASTAAPYTLPISSTLLAPYTSRPTFDVGSRTLMWTEDTTGQQADIVRAHIEAVRDDAPIGRAWSWRIVAKRDGTRVVLPQIPVVAADGFDYNLADGDTTAVLELTSAKLPGGFDRAFREHGFGQLSRLISGATGRLVTQDLYTPE